MYYRHGRKKRKEQHRSMEYLESVRAFLAPPPLSPIFQAGSQLDGWNEDICLILFFLFVLGAVDVCVVHPFLNPKCRYFALHLIANSIAAVAALPDLVRGLTTDPLYVFSGPSDTMVANSAVCAIHLYHCVVFKLRWDDLFHHLVFVFLLCGLAIPFKQISGVANNFGLFFLSGLPGGIDYFMLVCVCQRLMKKATQKHYYALLNVYIRGPSIVIYSFIGWQTMYHGTYGPPLPALITVVVLCFFNGQYYLHQAVATTTLFFYKQKLIMEGVLLPTKECDTNRDASSSATFRKKPVHKEDDSCYR